MKSREFGPEVFDNPYGFINDWYSLAAFTRAYPHLLSYALGHKDDLVERIQLKGRTVYQSKGSLNYTQKKLRQILKSLQDDPAMDHIWSYKKGVNPRERVQELVGWKWIVHTDVKKFFDNIDFRHIKKALETFGFTPSGASLVARYCTVKRGERSTLQQGCPISGEVSNLVGYVFFDQAILEMLAALQQQNPRMRYTYARYCDNLFLGLDGDIDIDVIKAYRAGVCEIMRDARFATHKWSTVPSNHPKRNQQVLGIVVNAQARIDNGEFQRVRAILFNACREGVSTAVARYFSENPTDAFDICATQRVAEQAKIVKFKQWLRGKISYIQSVSETQGRQLKKLYRALEELNDVRLRVQSEDGLHAGIFAAIKQYKADEDVDTYVERVQAAIREVVPRHGESTRGIQVPTSDPSMYTTATIRRIIGSTG